MTEYSQVHLLYTEDYVKMKYIREKYTVATKNKAYTK